MNELGKENKFLKEEIQSIRPGPDDLELRKEFIAYKQSYETVAQCWSMKEAALQKEVAELQKKLEVVKKEWDNVLGREESSAQYWEEWAKKDAQSREERR